MTLRALAVLAVLCTSPLALAQTLVPPGNTGTTTWTLAGSPYLLTGDVIVQNGAVLTIEPGVEIRVRAGDALMSGIDNMHVELTVRGTLVANGTSGTPITFLAETGTAAGTWQGLILESGGTSATLSNVIVQHATVGIRTSLPAATLNLSSTTVQASSTGMQISGGTPSITGITIANCTNGIAIDGGSPTLTNVLVTGTSSGNNAVANTTPGTTTFENATVSGGYDCFYTIGNLTIRDSIITNCGDDGVDRDAGTVSVTYSDVWGVGGSTLEGTITASNNFSARPLFVSASNFRLTSSSPCRFSGTTGDDMGPLPYVSDATPGLYGTLWVDTTVAAGTTMIPGDLTVAPGVTLTLSPGATLSFAIDDYMAAYTDSGHAELRVFGTLTAVGTAGSPITLTSAGTSAGSWYGLDLQGVATGSVIDNVVIEEANVGIRHRGTAGQTIRRTTIRGSSTGMQISSTPTLVDAITIANCTNGIAIDGGSPTLTNVLVTGTSSGNNAVANTTPGTTTFENATVSGGYDCFYTIGNLTIRDSIITNCGDDGVDRDAGTVSVTYSDVWGVGGSTLEGTITASNNFSARPLFVSASNFRLTSSSPCRFSGTTGDDMGPLPYVSDATPGLYGTLWVDTTVAAGTTMIPGDLTVAPGVTLTLSPGATLSFAIDDYMAAYTDSGHAELRVFGTLTAVGTAGSPITLTSAGTSAGSWYGLDLQGAATGSVIDNVVIEEANVGIRHRGTAGQTIRRTTIRGSSTGLQISSTPARVDAITIANCTNGMAIDGGSPTLTNVLVTGTSSGNNAIANTTPGTTTFVNGTVSGGYDCFYTIGNLTVVNTIIVNCGDDGVDRDAGTVSVTYSDISGVGGSTLEGTITASNNLSANPLFVSASDFHLQPSSTCIEAGTATGAPTTDRDGVARPLDGDGVGAALFDIGAYEYARTMFCGDGLVTSGEICDEAALNGMYGHCNSSCSGLGPRCGDSITNGPETCDDGNTVNTDACLNTCVAASCGDSYVRTGTEQCDDGNAIDTDGCVMCMNASCGDGHVRMGIEQCDDGNAVATDACVMCNNAFCGDAYVRASVEQCDDGNTSNTDMCLTTCMSARCGDGFVGPGEQCDDGNAIDTDGCSNTCRNAMCGDGMVQAGEECDDGNAINDDVCSNACRMARCGDGIRQSGEMCDDGNMVDDDMCTNACRMPRCGDGILQSGEECDDANMIATDGCTASCTTARCGDGVVESGVEQCDDGNTANTDACVGACMTAACGDGHVRSGVEACDDGNTIDGDGCSSTCALMSCGDGVVQTGEECDDGNASNLDACLGTCLNASCGDGFRRVGAEACDDGNTDDTDACLSTCHNASCGDGFVQSGVEECDDGNGEDTDGCLVSCQSATCGDGFVEDGVETCDDGNDVPGDGCSASCMTEAGADGGMPMSDGGMSMTDGGTGSGDGGTDVDGGTGPSERGGCGCRTAGTEGSRGIALILSIALGALIVRRRRRR